MTNLTEQELDTAERRSKIARWFVIADGRLVLGAIVIAAWQLCADLMGPLYVADPVVVMQRLVADLDSGAVAHHVASTVSLSVTGLALGCGVAVMVPFGLAQATRLDKAVRPYILASAGIPKYALVPLFILWFGIDALPKVLLVALLTFYPMFVGVTTGIRNIDRRLSDAVRILGGGRWTVARDVVWPSVIPFAMAALKVATSMAIGATLVGEMLIGGDGVGALITRSYENADNTGTFASIIVAVVLVLLIDVLMGCLWRGFSRGQAFANRVCRVSGNESG